METILKELTAKERYIKFVASNDVPIFFQPWYLDIVSHQGRWDVAVAHRGGQVAGVWPYFSKIKFGLTYCTQPDLTPYLGPLIIDGHQESKTSTKISREKKILNQLVDQLPKTLLFVNNGLPLWTNWQPLSWRGFHQTTRYTYIIDLHKSEVELRSALSDKNRNEIKKAEKTLKIQSNPHPEEIYKLICRSFARQNQEVPYSYEFFKSLDDHLVRHNARQAYSAYLKGKPVAVAYIIFDKCTAYLIVTGRNQDAPAGSVALTIWHCIMEAKKQGINKFDFEGSMIQSIEPFFRSFGGAQTPYHRLYRTSGKWSYILLKALNRL